MPPKLRGSLPKSLSRARDSSKAVFYCPSCAIWRRTLTTTTRASPIIPSVIHRANRSLATSSVVHGSRHVPPRLRELYEALGKVKNVANEQVNLSRLQLALRGLESEAPLIRVAVLGLNDATAARKLVRLLLADPLTPREPWEDALEAYNEDTARGLLIRYGETSSSIPNDLLPTISVPSQLLKKGNLEILVSTLGGAESAPSATELTAETFLVPTVTIQTSYTGRHNVVRYPVHKTIVCGRGVDDLLAYSGLLARSDLKNEAKSVYGAIELGVPVTEKAGGDRISFVDVAQADNALAKFRESVQNATLYERGWNGSGVQPVVDWVASAQQQQGTDDALDPSLRTLIGSLVDAAETGVVAEEARKLQELEALSVPDGVRDSLDRTVVEWAERGHSELRSELEDGFASKRWRGLAWWKLFWRVDDVSMITSEILERKYLRQAEKEVVWTAGRFQQAGLLDDTNPSTSTSTSTESTEPTTEAPEKPADSITPWPTQITTSRTRLLETTVPSLQALAQRLVLFSMSTTTLTSALSALTYVSLPTASVYEACTVAAVGLVYSLRRQQTKWQRAQAFWEDEVREDGRMALLETETHLRKVAQEGGRRVTDVSDPVARETVSRARQALDEVK